MAWWFFFPIAFFGGLTLIVAVVAVTCWMVFFSRGSSKNRDDSIRPDSALQIIRERYAKGEITKEQLEQITKDLH